MDIHTIEFKKTVKLSINNQTIQLTLFATDEPGNIKVGIDAPRGVPINREEIYKLKQEK